MLQLVTEDYNRLGQGTLLERRFLIKGGDICRLVLSTTKICVFCVGLVRSSLFL